MLFYGLSIVPLQLSHSLFVYSILSCKMQPHLFIFLNISTILLMYGILYQLVYNNHCLVRFSCIIWILLFFMPVFLSLCIRRLMWCSTVLGQGLYK